MEIRPAPPLFSTAIFVYLLYQALLLVTTLLFMAYDLTAGISFADYSRGQNPVLSVPLDLVHDALRLAALILLFGAKRAGAYLMFAVASLAAVALVVNGATLLVLTDFSLAALAAWMLAADADVIGRQRAEASRRPRTRTPRKVIELPAEAA